MRTEKTLWCVADVAEEMTRDGGQAVGREAQKVVLSSCGELNPGLLGDSEAY